MSGYTSDTFHLWTGGQADPCPGDCWKCAAVPFTTSIGLCADCYAELREGS